MDDLCGDSTRCKYCCSSLPPLDPIQNKFSSRRHSSKKLEDEVVTKPSVAGAV